MEYRIIRTPKATPRDLLPWMRCLETLIRSNKEAQESESIVLFHKEMSGLIFSVKNLDIELYDSNVMNEATLLGLKYIQTKSSKWNEKEKKTVKIFYPKFVEYVGSLP